MPDKMQKAKVYVLFLKESLHEKMKRILIGSMFLSNQQQLTNHIVVLQRKRNFLLNVERFSND